MELTSLLELAKLEVNQKITKPFPFVKSPPDAK
jgi:hypothetical protein